MGGSSSKPKPKPPAAKPAPPAAPKKPALLDSAVATTQVATRTDPGSGADDEDNQDAVHLSESGGVHVVALFDGHGDDGKAVADACAAAVLGCGVGKLKASGDAEAIAGCFQALHTGVCAEKGVDASESGASATVVVYDSNERAVLVGNAGDSKAVIGRGASGATGDGGPRRPAPMVLTSDHYPKVPAEKARIEAAGGRVHATDDVQLGAPPRPVRRSRPRARARAATPAARRPPTAHRRAPPSQASSATCACGSPGRAARSSGSTSLAPSATRSPPRSESPPSRRRRRWRSRRATAA